MKRILAHPVAWPATVLAAVLAALVFAARARAEISGSVDPGVESRVEEMQGLPPRPVSPVSPVSDDTLVPAPPARVEEPTAGAAPSPGPESGPATAGSAPSGEARDLEDTYGADIARLKQWYSSVCPVRAVSHATTVTSYSLEETLDRRLSDIAARIRAVGQFLVDPEGVVRSHMARAVSESRADLGEKTFKFSFIERRRARAEEIERVRLEIRLARERTAELESQLASGEFVRGVAARGSRMALNRLTKLVGYSDGYERLYQATRDCNSFARGNIEHASGGASDQDFVPGESGAGDAN